MMATFFFPVTNCFSVIISLSLALSLSLDSCLQCLPFFSMRSRRMLFLLLLLLFLGSLLIAIETHARTDRTFSVKVQVCVSRPPLALMRECLSYLVFTLASVCLLCRWIVSHGPRNAI